MRPPSAIVSYDGTSNDRDALALGRLLAGAGQRGADRIRPCRRAARVGVDEDGHDLALGDQLVVLVAQDRQVANRAAPDGGNRQVDRGGIVEAQHPAELEAGLDPRGGAERDLGDAEGGVQLGLGLLCEADHRAPVVDARGVGVHPRDSAPDPDPRRVVEAVG